MGTIVDTSKLGMVYGPFNKKPPDSGKFQVVRSALPIALVLILELNPIEFSKHGHNNSNLLK